MRYQERIYIQNQNSSVRNRTISNVNMSSDVCIFSAPLFTISGASKIDCSGTTSSHIFPISATTFDFVFDFTGNTATFSGNNATFKYELYKYDTTTEVFNATAVYSSPVFSYTGFSGTTLAQSVPISGLSLDGDYLIKGYYEFSACTEFMGKLGKTIDTFSYRYGSEYGLYDSKLDYYTSLIKEADKPILQQNGSNTPAANSLLQQVILPESGQTNITITSFYLGTFILTLNGLVLAKDLDYTVNGNIVSLSSETATDDVITLTYTTNGGNNLIGDNINITSSIASGTTGNEGSNTAYYNTTTGKYELYTSLTPAQTASIVVMINGATLANNIDYYASNTNTKRIILEGDLVVGDIITVVYYPTTNVSGTITTINPSVAWTIPTTPQALNGYFSLQVSTDSSFGSYLYSGYTPYQTGLSIYSDSFTPSGTVGTKLYYRVYNQKNYETLCGNIIPTSAVSETIYATIQSNAINSY